MTPEAKRCTCTDVAAREPYTVADPDCPEHGAKREPEPESACIECGNDYAKGYCPHKPEPEAMPEGAVVELNPEDECPTCHQPLRGHWRGRPCLETPKPEPEAGQELPDERPLPPIVMPYGEVQRWEVAFRVNATMPWVRRLAMPSDLLALIQKLTPEQQREVRLTLPTKPGQLVHVELYERVRAERDAAKARAEENVQLLIEANKTMANALGLGDGGGHLWPAMRERAETLRSELTAANASIKAATERAERAEASERTAAEGIAAHMQYSARVRPVVDAAQRLMSANSAGATGAYGRALDDLFDALRALDSSAPVEDAPSRDEEHSREVRQLESDNDDLRAKLTAAEKRCAEASDDLSHTAEMLRLAHQSNDSFRAELAEAEKRYMEAEDERDGVRQKLRSAREAFFRATAERDEIAARQRADDVAFFVSEWPGNIIGHDRMRKRPFVTLATLPQETPELRDAVSADTHSPLDELYPDAMKAADEMVAQVTNAALGKMDEAPGATGAEETGQLLCSKCKLPREAFPHVVSSHGTPFAHRFIPEPEPAPPPSEESKTEAMDEWADERVEQAEQEGFETFTQGFRELFAAIKRRNARIAELTKENEDRHARMLLDIAEIARLNAELDELRGREGPREAWERARMRARHIWGITLCDYDDGLASPLPEPGEKR